MKGSKSIYQKLNYCVKKHSFSTFVVSVLLNIGAIYLAVSIAYNDSIANLLIIYSHESFLKDNDLNEIGDIAGKIVDAKNGNTFIFNEEYIQRLTYSLKLFSINLPERKLAKIAEEHFNKKRYREALYILKIATTINPTNDRLWNNIGVAYINIGDRDKSIAAFQKAVEINSKNTIAQINLNLLRIKSGNSIDALNGIEKVIRESKKQYIKAYAIKAEALSMLGKDEEALECLEKVNKKNSDNIIILVAKANILSNLKKHNEALELINKALEKEPNNEDALFYYGVILSNFDEYQNKAIEVYKKVVEVNPNNIHALSNLAALYGLQGDYWLALEAADNALKIDGRYIYAKINKAGTLMMLNKYEEAKTILDQLVNENPKSVSILNIRSELLIRMGLLGEAKRDLDEILLIDKNNNTAKEKMEIVNKIIKQI